MQKVLGPIRRVRFTQSTLRQASIREKRGPSFGKIQVKNPYQRSPYAMKFEERSHEETERQRRCARSKAWNLAKNIYKLKENDKATSALVQHSCTFVVFLRVQTLPNVVHATEVKKEHLVVRTERVAHTHILSRALVINAHALAQGHVDCFNPCAS